MSLKKALFFWRGVFMAIGFVMLSGISGCSHITSEETAAIGSGKETQVWPLDTQEKEDDIIDICLDLYEKAAEENRLADLETIRGIVNRFGEEGYPAVDSRNQIDMTEAEQVIQFCKNAEDKEEANVSIIEVNYQGGFVKYDLEAKNGEIEVFESYYEYKNEKMKKKETGSYLAEYWNYTNEGYLMLSGTWFSKEQYVLTLSDAEEHAAFRVQPLDETCRELNRKYFLSNCKRKQCAIFRR